MSRHGNNATDRHFFSYHERAKLKYGTQKARLGKESMRGLMECHLCLHEVVSPLCTPEGVLFCKECIYNNLLQQKKDIARATTLWEEDQTRIQSELEEKDRELKAAEIANFEKLEMGLLPKGSKFKKITQVANVHNFTAPEGYKAHKTEKGTMYVQDEKYGELLDKRKQVQDLKQKEKKNVWELTCFWVPTLTPSAEKSIGPRPSQKTVCPITNSPLRLKDLVKTEFVRVKGAATEGRFMCPICTTTLTDNHLVSALRKSGKIVCNTCVKKFVMPPMKDYFTNDNIKAKDVIAVQAGGTGFAAHASGNKLSAELYRPMQGFG